jgi:hypothetical protein
MVFSQFLVPRHENLDKVFKFRIRQQITDPSLLAGIDRFIVPSCVFHKKFNFHLCTVSIYRIGIKIMTGSENLKPGLL